MWLFALVGACASDPTSTGSSGDAATGADVFADGSDASTAADITGQGDAPVPDGLQLRDHAVNIVHAEAAAEIVRYINGASPELYVSTRAFYEHFDDAYDFVYVFTDGPVMGATTAARFTPVRRPAIPGTGLTRAVMNTMYPASATRLRGAIGVNFSAVGNGPTLHETLHYWSMFLNASFGFGRDRDQGFGAHWGVASVNGQHGGFDLSTLRCNAPAGAQPPMCTPDPDGITRITVGTFGPNANGGDSRPYAPVELYLMGLVPAAEAGGPFLVLDGAHFVSNDATTRRMTFEITGAHSVSMDDIVRAHGVRAPATMEERTFRAAFVVFSTAPVSVQRMDALERWAAIMGNDMAHPALYSFERATGGRATMSTRLGVAH